MAGLTLEKLLAAREILRRQNAHPPQYFSEALLRQYRRPRSRKRRIRKKWALDPTNWRMEWVSPREAEGLTDLSDEVLVWSWSNLESDA
jgi:ribosomal protein L32E